MPPLPDRDKRERRLAALIRSAVEGSVDGRGIDWGRLGAALVDIFGDELGRAYLDAWQNSGAEGLTSGATSPDLSTWAQRMAVDLSNRLATNFRRELASGVAPETTFARDRWSTIATTELTRAATAGERDAILADSLGSEPPEPAVSVTDENPAPTNRRSAGTTIAVPPGYKGIWFNIEPRDGRVCPICSALHLAEESEWREIAGEDWIYVLDGPPAHPNCRCHLEFIPEDWDPRDLFESERASKWRERRTAAGIAIVSRL